MSRTYSLSTKASTGIEKATSSIQCYQANCYDSITLELIKERNLILGLIQENSMENSVQNCLLYILKPHDLCYYCFGLP